MDEPNSITEDTLAIDNIIILTIAALKSRPNVNSQNRIEAYRDLLIKMFKQRENSFETKNENIEQLIQVWSKILSYFKILDGSTLEENDKKYTDILNDLDNKNREVLVKKLELTEEQINLLAEYYAISEKDTATADTRSVYEKTIPNMEKRSNSLRNNEIALEEWKIRQKKSNGNMNYLKDIRKTENLEKKSLSIILEKRKKATCIVQSSNSSGNKNSNSTGTGWYIGNHLIVTNAHVILYENEVNQLTEYDKISCNFEFLDKKSRKAIVHIYDSINDIALLQLSDDTDLQGEEMPLAKDNTISMGQAVYTFGNSIGYGIVPQNGMIQDCSFPVVFQDKNEVIKAEDVIRTTLPIRDGNSGGPLLNDKGEVIGIMSSNLKDSNNIPCPELSIARKISCIKKLLNQK